MNAEAVMGWYMLLHSVAFITGQFLSTTGEKHARHQLQKNTFALISTREGGQTFC